jgi:hypothetical protein
MVSVKTTGVKPIDYVLKRLPQQLNHRVLQSAHYDAAKVLVNEAKNLAPEGPTGNLVDSIGTVRPSMSKASELGLIEVGPRRGRYKGNAAHLVEYGTVQRRNKRGANRGKMTAKPFMFPAWEKTKDRIRASINTNIGTALWRFMKRTIKNG